MHDRSENIVPLLINTLCCDIVRIQVSSPTTYGSSFKSSLQIKTCSLMLRMTFILIDSIDTCAQGLHAFMLSSLEFI